MYKNGVKIWFRLGIKSQSDLEVKKMNVLVSQNSLMRANIP
nr:MAG TPA: hypothetical protein [Caudoviricetes sp.]